MTITMNLKTDTDVGYCKGCGEKMRETRPWEILAYHEETGEVTRLSRKLKCPNATWFNTWIGGEHSVVIESAEHINDTIRYGSYYHNEVY